MNDEDVFKKFDIRLDTKWQSFIDDSDSSNGSRPNPNPQLLGADAEGVWVAEVNIASPAIISSACRYEARYFPFDLERCVQTVVDLVSTHDVSQLRQYIKNEEWDFVSFVFSKEMYQSSSSGKQFSLLHATATIKRRAAYYIYTLIIPTLLIVEMSLIGFFTPASSNVDRSEKINLGMTTLLAMSIMLMMVADIMPITSDYISLMGIFFMSVMGLIALGTLASVIVMEYQRNLSKCRVPSRKRRIWFDWIAPLLAVEIPEEIRQEGERRRNRRRRKGHVHPKTKQTHDNDEADNEELKKIQILDGHRSNRNRISSSNSIVELMANDLSPDMPIINSETAQNRLMIRKLTSVYTVLQSLLDEIQGDKQLEMWNTEWRFLCEIMDRLLLILFNLALFSITAYFFVVGLFQPQ